jgi:hypothetical protein
MGASITATAAQMIRFRIPTSFVVLNREDGLEALLWRAAHRTLTPQSARESPPALLRRLEIARVPRGRSEG